MANAIDQANVGEFTQDTAGSTIAITTGVNVASGGFIVLTIGWAVTASAPTLSSVSGGSLTWTIDKQGASVANGAAVAIVSAQAPSGLASGTVITATLSGSTTGARVLLGSSWTGVATSSPVDVAGAIQTITSTTAWTTGNLTVLAGSLIVGFAAGLNTDGTSTPTSPSIETHDVTGGAGSYNDTAAYRIESGAGTVAVAGTFSTSQTGTGVGVAYKAAAGGTTWFGSSTFPIAVGYTTAGTRKTFGTSTTPIVVSYTTAGTRKTFATSTFPVVVGYTTAGRRKVFAASTFPVVVTYTTAGKRTATGASTFPVVVGYTTTAKLSARGSSTFPIVFSYTTTGSGGAGTAVAVQDMAFFIITS